MRRILTNVVAILAVCVCHPAFAASVSGTISTNSTWSSAMNPVTVIGNVVVPSGVTLTIAAGSEVRIQPGLTISVNGRLTASGVTFTNDLAQAWGGGIMFSGNSLSVTGTFSNCRFVNVGNVLSSSPDGTAPYAIFGSNAVIEISDCYATLTESNAFLNMIDSRLTLQNTTITNVFMGVRATRLAGLIANSTFIGSMHEDCIQGMGTFAGAGGPNLWITNCVIGSVPNTGGSNEGIQLADMTNAYVYGCVVTNIADVGLQLRGGGYYEVVNCFVSGANSVGIYVQGTARHKVINCTSRGNNGAGIQCGSSANGAVTNCIAWGNNGGNLNVEAGAVFSFGYNNFGGTNAAGTGNINADPLFVSASANTYAIPTNSPSADAGINFAWMTGAKDIRGSNRISNVTVDMGCYEAAWPVASGGDFTLNGTPKTWLELHYGTSIDHEAYDVADTDSDGAQSWEEYIAGTVPTNSTSVLMVSQFYTSSGNVYIKWGGQTGRTYTVYRSSAYSNLYSSPLMTGISPAATNAWTDPIGTTATARAIYRIGVTKDP